MSRLRTAIALGSCALLVLPAAAVARPGQRGFDRTFPHASKLCAHVANGRGPAKLRPASGQVNALCATLRSSFTTAQNTYFTATTPLRQQATALIAKTRATCKATPGPTCKQARAAAKVTLAGLRAQVRTAATTYRTSIQSARTTFWNAVKQLRGASKITADTVTPAAPAVTIPTTA